MSAIDIAQGQTLRGVFETPSNYTVTVNGPGKFAPSVFVDNGNTTINAAVVGVGSFVTALNANLTFASSVGQGQSAYLAPGATITIDKPNEFHGSIGYASSTEPTSGPYGEFVDLVGLQDAASYSLRNDLLTIKAANGHAIDTLRLQPGFAPSQVIKDAGSVYLTLGYGEYRIPGGPGAGTLLPHS